MKQTNAKQCKIKNVSKQSNCEAMEKGIHHMDETSW